MQAMSGQRNLEKQRAAARRTAWWLALVAAAIFSAFFLSGVLGK